MIYTYQCSTKADVCTVFFAWSQPTWLYCALQHMSLNSPELHLLRCGFCKVSLTSRLTPVSLGQWCCSISLPDTVRYLKTPVVLSRDSGLSPPKVAVWRCCMLTAEAVFTKKLNLGSRYSRTMRLSRSEMPRKPLGNEVWGMLDPGQC